MVKSLDPHRLDIMAFARAAGALEGTLPLAALERLAESSQPAAEVPPVRWQARAELRTPTGGAAQPWLHLQAQAQVQLTCQRCLQAMPAALEVDRWFRFAPDEAAAAALDDEVEEDVLAVSRAFDLLALVEDELLMALPLVPRHDHCPVEVPLQATDPGFEAANAEQAHPFAALARLRLDADKP